jgi:hypothetical protein
MLTFQSLINIAEVTNSLPYTGVTLPLVSFGGSSTVISMIAIGLLLNISRQPAAAAELEPAIDDDPQPTPSPRENLPRMRVSRVERRRHMPVQVAPLRARTRGARRV